MSSLFPSKKAIPAPFCRKYTFLILIFNAVTVMPLISNAKMSRPLLTNEEQNIIIYLIQRSFGDRGRQIHFRETLK